MTGLVRLVTRCASFFGPAGGRSTQLRCFCASSLRSSRWRGREEAVWVSAAPASVITAAPAI